jgi:hypothetical protein
LRIEIGGADQQNAALDPFSGDFLQKCLVDIFLNQSRQRRVVGQGSSFEQTGYVVGENVLSSVFGKNLPQLTIVFAPKEGKGRNQRAGTDTGDQVEYWPRACVAPANQQAGTKSTVLGAS